MPFITLMSILSLNDTWKDPFALMWYICVRACVMLGVCVCAHVRVRARVCVLQVRAHVCLLLHVYMCAHALFLLCAACVYAVLQPACVCCYCMCACVLHAYVLLLISVLRVCVRTCVCVVACVCAAAYVLLPSH